MEQHFSNVALNSGRHALTADLPRGFGLPALDPTATGYYQRLARVPTKVPTVFTAVLSRSRLRLPVGFRGRSGPAMGPPNPEDP
jgi:hypothetical protein